MMFDMRAKPPRSLSRLLNAEPLTQTTVAVWVGLCCVLLATVAYWTVLVDSHRTQRSFTESQSWLRVGQMSHAVSVQVQTLLSGLDYTMRGDRKSTRLNSSHSQISYAVFCLKKKKKKRQ